LSTSKYSSTKLSTNLSSKYKSTKYSTGYSSGETSYTPTYGITATKSKNLSDSRNATTRSRSLSGITKFLSDFQTPDLKTKNINKLSLHQHRHLHLNWPLKYLRLNYIKVVFPFTKTRSALEQKSSVASWILNSSSFIFLLISQFCWL
jgi:hypothetical protein